MKSAMSSFFVALFFATFPSLLPAQGYRYRADLTDVKEDQVKVELTPPPLSGTTAVFHMPRIVPGTYDVYDFGRFVSDFHALDAQGKELSVTHPDVNTWEISDPAKAVLITYLVDDTWDADDDGNFVFEPGGTNIEAGKNFVINNHGFFGFFKGMNELPFEVTFTRPGNFFGASALRPTSGGENKDIFKAKNYFELMDSPIMYCEPDTTEITVGGARVLFAVYAPSKEMDSRKVADEVAVIMEAQRKYLGGTLPVDRYAFIIYLFEGLFGGSGSYGALEHNHCSLYYLPEYSPEFLAPTIRDFSAHEFFHIVTPLSIHSEEIHYFDYTEPEMSEHLWLYEGVTEYFAGHVQASYDILTLEEYLEDIREKIMDAENYREDISFTTMSKGVLYDYKDEYGNVYQKGALIGLCLDLVLRKASDGKTGLRDLMQELMKKYGPDRPFKDAELFHAIGELSYPEAETFLKNCVGGTDELPLAELLGEVGILYAENFTTETWSLGGVNIDVTDENRIWITDTYDMDAFGEKLGYKEGDILMAFNGKDLTTENAEELFSTYFSDAEEGDDFSFDILRPKKPGSKKTRKMTLSAPLQKVEKSEEFYLAPNPEATPAQLMLRSDWLLGE
jgi:predicted metalloprotease with PDZ domain